MSKNTIDSTANIPSMVSESEHERVLKIIRQWKFFWMNQTQNSEEDRKNYFERAFGVDSNMMHDLARRITETK